MEDTTEGRGHSEWRMPLNGWKVGRRGMPDGKRGWMEVVPDGRWGAGESGKLGVGCRVKEERSDGGGAGWKMGCRGVWEAGRGAPV